MSSTFDKLDGMLNESYEKQMRFATAPKAARVVCYPTMADAAKDVRRLVEVPQGIIDTANAKIRELLAKCELKMDEKKKGMRQIVERLAGNTDGEMYELIYNSGHSDDVKILVQAAKELRKERGGNDDNIHLREKVAAAQREAKEKEEENARLRRKIAENKQAKRRHRHLIIDDDDEEEYRAVGPVGPSNQQAAANSQQAAAAIKQEPVDEPAAKRCSPHGSRAASPSNSDGVMSGVSETSETSETSRVAAAIKNGLQIKKSGFSDIDESYLDMPVGQL